MGAQQSNVDQAAFNDRVGRATINAFRLAVGALVASTVIGLATIIISLPTVQKALDARVLDALAWLTAKWTLPWPAWVALLLACTGIGTRIGRQIHVPGEVGPSHPSTLEQRAPTKPRKPEPPRPEQLTEPERLALAGLAIAHDWIEEGRLANALGVDKLSLRAALLRLRSPNLVMDSNLHWKLTERGTMYVDDYRQIVLRNTGAED